MVAESLSDRDDLRFQFRQAHDRNRVRICSIQSPGIEHQRLANSLATRHVRVAVAHKLMHSVGDRSLQQPTIVAVQQRDLHARKFQ